MENKKRPPIEVTLPGTVLPTKSFPGYQPPSISGMQDPENRERNLKTDTKKVMTDEVERRITPSHYPKHLEGRLLRMCHSDQAVHLTSFSWEQNWPHVLLDTVVVVYETITSSMYTSAPHTVSKSVSSLQYFPV